MKNNTKIAMIFLFFGCFGFIIGLFLILTIQRSEGQFLDSSIWHLIWFGIFSMIIGIVCIIPLSKTEN